MFAANLMEERRKIQCKKVAVVVLGYNSVDYLKRFLPSVVSTNYSDCTIVYVDNASVDNSVEFVSSEFPEVEIFRIYENHGFTNGYEESLPWIDAEYYVLLNSDVEVDPNWLTPMMEVMERNPKVGACQPKIIHQPSPPLFDYAGASGGFMDKYGYCFCRGRLFHHLEEDKGQYEDNREIFWATGACMLIRSELYHGLGGLDNDFYAHMEEIDLCWRMKNAGYKLMVVPSGVVYHVGGSVITYGSFTKLYHNYRNNLVMMYKNLRGGQLLSRLGVRLVLDQVAAAKALLSGNFTEFKAVEKANFDFLFRLGKWKKNRKEAQSHYAQPELGGQYMGNIVIDVFAKGIKSFSQLKESKFK